MTQITNLEELLTFIISSQDSFEPNPNIVFVRLENVFSISADSREAIIAIENTESILNRLLATTDFSGDTEECYGFSDVLRIFVEEYPSIMPHNPCQVLDALRGWVAKRDNSSEALSLTFKGNADLSSFILATQDGYPYFFSIPTSMSAWTKNFLAGRVINSENTIASMIRQYKVEQVLG